MTVQPILAKLVEEFDVLTDREGKYSRMVTEVDPFSNKHGKIILRTGKGSTVVNPDTVVHVLL